MKNKQKQEVPFEIRLVQSMIIGAELMMLYALVILIFDSNEPFEWLQTRAFGLAVLPAAWPADVPRPFLRPADLEDVFLRLTGRGLDVEDEDEA